MLTAVALVLGATAFLAGVTGAWSPCGFSMVDTLAREERRSTLYAACAAFALGALAGGVATFGTLSLFGALLRGSGVIAGAVAAAIAVAAAAGEARGVRIVPQIRRQVPEPWRRVLPLPLAAALYGVLLGLGFTTFVLTLAVWALAGISVVLGQPAVGAAIGLAFGAGRALPVVALAPFAETAAGARVVDLMAQRPSLLRGLRRLDALALAASAVVLGAGAAGAATGVASPATDPSAAGTALAWQTPGVGGFLRRGTQTLQLPGSDPALGGRYIAWRAGDHVTVAAGDTLAPVLDETIPGVQKLAVSDRWLVFRQARADGGAFIAAQAIGSTARARYVAGVRWPAQLGRPAISDDLVVFHVANRLENAIVSVDLRSGKTRRLRRSRTVQFLNPSLSGSQLLYVRVSRCAQELRLGSANGKRERVLFRAGAVASRDSGHEHTHTKAGSEPTQCPGGQRSPARVTLWTTALTSSAAYLTLLQGRGGAPSTPSLVQVAR